MRHIVKSATLSFLLLVACAQAGPVATTVYTTKTGTKYHKESCSSLRKSKIKTDIAAAKKKGLTACKRCKPPKD